MVKQGGTTANLSSSGNPMNKSTRRKCRICNRSYAQDWTRDNHERICATFNKVNIGG